MVDVSIVDAHVHFWDPRTTPRAVTGALRLGGWSPWFVGHVLPRLFPRAMIEYFAKTDYIVNAYLPKQWLEDAGSLRVRGYVHVQADWHEKGRYAAANETRWLESIGGERLLAIVGEARLDEPDLDTLLDEHATASKRFVGVRDMTAWHPSDAIARFAARAGRMQTEAWRRGLALLGERGLSFDAWCYSPQLGDLEEAVRAAPATRIVLCHLGTPLAVGGPYGGLGATAAARTRILDAWRHDLARLAQHHNVHAKISGLLMPALGFAFHTRATPPSVDEIVDRIGPLVEHALAVFGDDRCFFASNFPVDKVSAPLAKIYAAYDQLTQSRSALSRTKLFASNAAAFYRAR